MTLTKEQLRAVQLKQLETMVEIDRICREQGLRYYLIGGTLLGAVRHKGFIPWDDDLDIAMPRKDYDRFMEIGQRFLRDKYFLQNYETEECCFIPFAKVRVNGTIFKEAVVAHLNCHHGVFVDIFPLDRVSSTPKTRKRDAFYCTQLQRIISAKLGLENSGSKTLNRLRSLVGRCFTVRLLGAHMHRVLRRHQNINTGLLTNALSPYGAEKEMLPFAQYGRPLEVDFEGYHLFAPAESEILLKQVYGDFMKLPPEEERGGWHDIRQVLL